MREARLYGGIGISQRFLSKVSVDSFLLCREASASGGLMIYMVKVLKSYCF